MTVDLGWVDIGLLLFMALSIVVGLMRGVVFEVLSLAGWVVAYIAAQGLTPVVQPYTSIGQAGSALNHAVAFASVFLVTLVLWGLGARLVRLLIRATPLSSVDRLLGAAFGLVRGLLVLLLLALVLGFTPVAKWPSMQRSQGVAWLNMVVKEIMPWLPIEVKQPSSA
ncbi:MAG: CvpA family protein [Burkholderiales bacterium]